MDLILYNLKKQLKKDFILRTKIENLMEKYLLQQYMEKLNKTREEFSYREIHRKIKYIYSQTGELKDNFDSYVGYHYKKEKKRLLNRIDRIEKSNKLTVIQKKYPTLEVMNSVRYLILINKLSLTYEDMNDIETFIEIMLGEELSHFQNKKPSKKPSKRTKTKEEI